jgi:hypothetical protein
MAMCRQAPRVAGSARHFTRIGHGSLNAAQPDLTLTEVLQQLADRGVAIGIGSIWRFFDREGISFKKNAVALRAGQARRRKQKGKLEKTSRKS